MKIFLIFLISYFIGAIPTGYIISKYIYHLDITKYGSGNIGMTNVQRVLGNKPAFIVFIIDCAEGAIPTLIALYALKSIYLATATGVIAAFAHDYSLFMKGFKGGKGAATSFGVLLVISPLAALISVVIFGGVIFITKYVSLGTIVAAITYPFILLLIKKDVRLTLLSIIFSILIIVSHRENIKRLIKGKERKIGEKVKIDERH
jgi:glycerol-3-phosphate acyltransferase PlsY